MAIKKPITKLPQVTAAEIASKRCHPCQAPPACLSGGSLMKRLLRSIASLFLNSNCLRAMPLCTLAFEAPAVIAGSMI